MPRIPNLFIIGAMKSGTSSICNYLGTHPEIFMSHMKESDGTILLGKIASCSSSLPKQYQFSRAILKGLKVWLKSKVFKKVDFDFSSNDFQNDISITRAAVMPLLRGWVRELEQLTGCTYHRWPIVENETLATERALNLAEEI